MNTLLVLCLSLVLLMMVVDCRRRDYVPPQPRNRNGTFRKARKPLRSGGILRELRELLWPSDSKEMGIKRGYRDGRG